MATHLTHLLAKHLQGGGGVLVEDGCIRLTSKPVPTREDLSEENAYPEYTGDEELDTIERRVALGLPPDPED